MGCRGVANSKVALNQKWASSDVHIYGIRDRNCQRATTCMPCEQVPAAGPAKTLPPVANTEFIDFLLLPPRLSPAPPWGGGAALRPVREPLQLRPFFEKTRPY